MNPDGSPAIPMTTNVNKSGGYLEVIVSEVVQLVLTQQVLVRVPVRDDSVSSRYRKKIRSRVREIRKSLPPVYITIISDTLPLDIRHSTFNI